MDKSMIMPCLVAAVMGAGVGYLGYTESHKSELEFCKNYHEVIEAYDLIKENYYTEPTDNVRISQELVKGFVKGLDDRFTTYDTEEEYQTKYVNGSPSVVDSGFAVERDEITKYIKVTKVEEGSQAEKYGLKENDLITAIDGTKVERENYSQVVQLIPGKDGTNVKFDILRGKENISIDFVRVNTGRKDTSVDIKVLDNQIGYIKFGNFADGGVGCKEGIRTEIENLEKDGKLKGIVFDVRNNIGGVGGNAVGIFDLFAGSGSAVKYTDAKTGEVFEQNQTSDEIVYDMPIAVLVSGESYSAAEIFAALVQSTGRGTVIGTQTGGKGVYQFSEYLSDTTFINLVEGYYYVNDLPNFNNVGITPDIVIEPYDGEDDTEKDVQLEKALEILN